MSQEDQAEQEKKKPWYKRWWVIAIVVVVGLVVVGSLLPEAEDAPASEPTPPEPATPPPVISAIDLYQEREANATRYDLNYKGKWVQITGVVGAIEGGEVRLVAGGSFLSNVYLHDLSPQEQARADKWQEFTALCRVGNYILGTINLRDCRAAATPSPTDTPTPTMTPEPTAMPTPTATPDNTPKTEFGNGSYEVGVDIAPGTYRSEGPEDPFPLCSFARLKTAGASFADLDQVIDVQNVQGPAIAKIEASDGGFFSQGCKTWVQRN